MRIAARGTLFAVKLDKSAAAIGEQFRSQSVRPCCKLDGQIMQTANTCFVVVTSRTSLAGLSAAVGKKAFRLSSIIRKTLPPRVKPGD
jgi:hypothetical protein